MAFVVMPLDFLNMVTLRYFHTVKLLLRVGTEWMAKRGVCLEYVGHVHLDPLKTGVEGDGKTLAASI